MTLLSRFRAPRASAIVRITGWCHSQLKPSAISARHCGLAARPSCIGLRRTVIAATSAADAANEPASTTNGRAKPTASSRPASGGPTNWLATISAEYSRPFARSRSASVTRAGMNVWALLS